MAKKKQSRVHSTSDKKHQRVRKSHNHTRLLVLFFVFLALSLPLVIYALQQPTGFTPQASKETTNLNEVSGIGFTNNPDGTMGPVSYTDNYAATVPVTNTGTVKVSMKSITTPKTLTSLKLVITKAEVHLTRPNTSETKPLENSIDHWETIEMAAPVTIDVAALAKSGAALLGTTKLAAGRYAEIRLYIKSATLTLDGGRTFSLSMLGKDNIIRVLQPFTVLANKSSTVSLEFSADRSVIKAGDTYLLRPVITRMQQEAY